MGNQTNNFYGPVGQFVDHPQNNVQFVTFQSDGTMRVEQPQDATPDEQDVVPVNVDDNTASEPEETLEQAETITPASEQPVEEENLDLFLVTKDSPRDTCEMVLDSIFRSSRSKKMVCEKLYKNEGSYFRLGAVGREERAKWLNQFPSNWQGRFLPDDMKYWRKTKK